MSTILTLALGAYCVVSIGFGFLFILGGGNASSTSDKILSVVFSPGIVVSYVLVSLFGMSR